MRFRWRVRRPAMFLIALFVLLIAAPLASAWPIAGLWSMTGTVRSLVIEGGQTTLDRTDDFGSGEIVFRSNRKWTMSLQSGKVKGRWRGDGTLTRINYKRFAKMLAFQAGLTLRPSGGSGFVTYVGPDECRFQLAVRMAASSPGSSGQFTLSWDLTGAR